MAGPKRVLAAFPCPHLVPLPQGLGRVIGHEFSRQEAQLRLDVSRGVKRNDGIWSTELEDPIQASSAWRKSLSLGDDSYRYYGSVACGDHC